MRHLDPGTAKRPASPTRGIHRRGVRPWTSDHGSASTELVLVTPLLVLVLLVAVALGRMASARLRVDDAAHQAARAASLARTADDAQRRAQTTARAALTTSGASCAHFTVTADVGAMTPGTVVRVSVACTANLGVSALPAHVTVTRNALSVIDSFRGTQAA
jgi:Flp pilus assembly protein TadG